MLQREIPHGSRPPEMLYSFHTLSDLSGRRTMNHRQRVKAILHYENYDRMPLVAFGYWDETLQKWADEGHIPHELADGYAQRGDNSDADHEIMTRLGFDFNWNSCVGGQLFAGSAFVHAGLHPDRPVHLHAVAGHADPDGGKIPCSRRDCLRADGGRRRFWRLGCAADAGRSGRHDCITPKRTERLCLRRYLLGQSLFIFS